MSKNRSYTGSDSPFGYGRIVDELLSARSEDSAERARSVITVFPKDGKAAKSHSIPVELPMYRWLLLIGDLMVIALASFLATWFRFGLPVNILAVYTTSLIVTFVMYPPAIYVFDLYNTERSFCSFEMVYRSALAVILGGVLAITVFYIAPYGPYGRGIMAIQMGLTWTFLNIWRWIYQVYFRKAVPKEPALILGAGYCGRTIYRLLQSQLSPYDVKGLLDDDPLKLGEPRPTGIIGKCDDLAEIAMRVGASTAILAIPNNRSDKLIRNVLYARLRGMDVRDMADVYEQLTGRIPVRSIGDQWLLFAEGFYLLHKEYIQKLKRLVDLVASGLILFLTAPIIGLTALAIKIDSPGPIFYSQKRVGKGQKAFPIYKFRSMRHDAEAGGAQWAREKDPRITRIGKLLRLTHVDEIPQIWNIFKGDMSLVGPRPERPEFVEILDKEIPYYFVRHSVKPGMTGWAQVNYRYGASIEDTKIKLEYDLYYVKNMSIFLDFKILLRTVGVVLLGDGAR